MTELISNYIKQFEYYQSLADRAVAQITKTQVFESPNEVSNSVAIIMKHMAGNMLSRWTDIFNTDGEKEWRNRDQEFVISEDMDFEGLIAYWQKGWQTLYDTLKGMTDDDLQKIIYIRNMGHTVQEAIIRQICHYPYHVGQIVYICRMIAGDSFTSLSIPKGNSTQYNVDKFSKEKSRKHFTEDL